MRKNFNNIDLFGCTAATGCCTKAADNNTISPYCLLQAGLIYEKQGKKNDALKVYTEIKEKYYASMQAMDIDKYINRVK